MQRMVMLLTVVVLGAIVVVVEYRAQLGILPLLAPAWINVWPESVYVTSPDEMQLRSACPHIRPVNITCPRFLTYVVGEDCGLGQKVTEVLFGWYIARYLDATYAFDFGGFSKSQHEAYDWAVSYFGLTEGEVITVQAAKQLYNVAVVGLCPYTTPRPPNECNVLYRVPYYDCCATNCFESPGMRGAFDDGKVCMRAKHLAAAARIPPEPSPFSPEHIALVWHLRVGDFRIHANDAAFFQTVWTFISEALRPLPLHNYFVGEQKDAIANFFPFLSSFPNTTVLALPVLSSMRTFQAADILIGSGSSFPQVAALATSSFLFLNHLPKHPYGGLEHMSDAPFMWPNGTIMATQDELRVMTLAKVCARRRHLAQSLWWVSAYCAGL